MLPFDLPRPTGIKPLYFTCLLALLGLATSLHILVLVGQWSGLWRGTMYWRGAPTVLHVSLEGHDLEVPAALLSAPAHSLSQLTGDLFLSRLQLAVLWPSMAGLQTGTAPDANPSGRQGDRKHVLTIAISPANQAQTLTEELDAVYLSHAETAPEPGPAGLMRLRMPAAEDQAQLDFLYEESRPGGFVTRCEASAGRRPVCRRNYRDGPFLVEYNFDPSLLSNWGSLERKVRALVGSL